MCKVTLHRNIGRPYLHDVSLEFVPQLWVYWPESLSSLTRCLYFTRENLDISHQQPVVKPGYTLLFCTVQDLAIRDSDKSLVV